MQRARQGHQKRERRAAILAAALATLQDTPYQDLTMTQVAARAGLVKGTLYLYFTTKEELFLELLRDQLHGWLGDLEAGLEPLPRRGRLEAAARLVADTALARPLLRTLLGVLPGTLERNLSVQTIMAFQREWTARTAAMGSLLESALPFLAQGEGVRLLHRICVHIIGLQALADPGRRAPTARVLQLDFHPELLLAVRALLRELKAQTRPQARPAP
jgi:AcrR family transcriptional regulator